MRWRAVNTLRSLRVAELGIAALRLLYPPLCVLCGAPARERDLCAGCEADLPYNRSACERCALPLAGRASPLCGACLARPPPWDLAFSLLEFTEPADWLLRALKFHGQLACGRVLGELMACALAQRSRPLPERLVPVPLHPGRLRERGFNQATELARPLARRLHMRLQGRLCRRVRRTAPQTGLDARARRRNLRGAFVVDGRLDGEPVAVVDDVLTTGVTVGELARALARAGAGRVEVWTCARALPPRSRHSSAGQPAQIEPKTRSDPN